MLTYSFINIGKEKLYEHLYKCIKKDILNGTLKADEKLPSKRNLAKNLGISTVTIETAYEQLLVEGYIYSLPKKGFYIARINNIDNVSAEKNTINSNMMYPKQTYFADFISNQTNPNYFPFSIWAKLIRDVMNEKSHELMTNPMSGGILELRKSICNYLKQFRGINTEPEQIIIGAGTEYLYGLIIQLLGYEKTYAVEDPGYKKIYQIYTSNNVKCEFIPLDENGVVIDILEEKKSDIIHISPSHHFPTGQIMPISRRYELLAWASKSDSRYIIEDEYDSEFRLLGNPIPTLQSIDVLEKVIYINTFSKSLASTIRISYMVLPKHLVKTFYDKLSFYSCTVSTFEQYTLSRFINEGYFEKHINRMRNYYKKKRNIIMDCINNSSLYKKCEISEEFSGLHFLLKLNTSLSDKELLTKLKNNGINIALMSDYYHNSTCNKPHTLIINYSGIDDNKIPEAIKLLSQSIL